MRRSLPYRSLLCVLLAFMLLLCGCARRADMDDIRTLQAAIDELRLENYELSQRIAALETGGNAPEPTPAPENTPAEPAHTPVPVQAYSMTADEICSQMLKNGMPISSFYRRSASSDPDKLLGTKDGYTSRADFRNPDIPAELGVIEVFASGTLASLRESVIKNEIKSKQRAAETVFRYDNVLMRLPAAFSSELTLAYEEGLRKVLGAAG